MKDFQVDAMLRLAEAETAPCEDLYAMTAEHLAETRRKIADLERLEASLVALAADCPCPEGSHCPILDSLAADAPPKLGPGPDRRC